jgi:transposase-like protein
MTTAAPDPDGPRSERPLRRSFTTTQKLEHLAAYEAACQTSQGGAYLRSEGLFSSQITEWRKLRDAGVLTGKQPAERVAKPSAEQAEIARLRRDLDRAERRLATTETALTIMGKAHALLEQISESADTDDRRGTR